MKKWNKIKFKKKLKKQSQSKKKKKYILQKLGSSTSFVKCNYSIVTQIIQQY